MALLGKAARFAIPAARGSLASLRTVPLNRNPRAPILIPRRHMGFVEEFMKRIKEKTEADEEFKAKLEELKKESDEAGVTEAAQKTSAAARAGVEKTKEYGGKAGVAASRAREYAEEVKDRVDDIKEEVADNPFVARSGSVAGKVSGAVKSGVGKVVHGVADTVESAAHKAAETKLGKNVAKQFEEEGPAKPARVMDKPIDKETETIMLRPESEWERRWNRLREAPVIGPLVRAASTVKAASTEAVSTAGDKVFGETETAIVMSEIKKFDPTFDIDRFFEERLRKDLIPVVLNAFMSGDLETLRPICMERSYTVLGHIIKDRESKGHVAVASVLDIGDIELVAARLVDDNPVLILSFSAQQVNCVRDKKGMLVEGAPDEIRNIYYAWAMMIDPDSADDDWKLSEMHIQGSFPQIA